MNAIARTAKAAKAKAGQAKSAALGFIKRHTVELNMDKVASVDVDQSIFGRLLNYGDITVHGTGDSDVIESLHNIGAPLDFRNHVTAR